MLIRFVHFLGISLWLGGAVAAMVLAFSARPEPPAARAVAYRLLAKIHGMVIGTGAILTVVSGLVLSGQLVQMGLGERLGQSGIAVMQLSGIIAAMLALLVGLPTAVKQAGLSPLLEEGQNPEILERLRKRQAIVSSIAGVLLLIALLGATVM